jgi:hypothetical protein
MSPHTLADPLHERLLEAFPADTAYRPADWPADAMPGPLRHYLIQLLRHRAQQEAPRLQEARSRWVNHDHPEVQEAAHAYFQAVSDHPQVPAAEWSETLRTATRRTTAYLVRPVATLSTVVFETTDPVPVPQILERMRFFEPYAYLRNAVDAFATKRNRDRLEADTFETVLRRIDARMAADFDANRWLDVLEPLFETAHHATGTAQVPRPLLSTFFDAKNATAMVQRLRALEPSSQALDAAALRQLLQAPRRDASEASAQPPPEHSSPAHSSPEHSPDTSPTDDRPTSPSTETPPPMWKQFEQAPSPRPSDAATAEDATPLWAQFQREAPAPRSASQDTPSAESPSSALEPSAEASSSSAPDEALRDLEASVFGSAPAPKRAVYIEKLFQGNREAYREVLARLRTIDHWREASQTIAREVFRAHQVNIYSDAAVHFTNAVEAGLKAE